MTEEEIYKKLVEAGGLELYSEDQVRGEAQGIMAEYNVIGTSPENAEQNAQRQLKSSLNAYRHLLEDREAKRK